MGEKTKGRLIMSVSNLLDVALSVLIIFFFLKLREQEIRLLKTIIFERKDIKRISGKIIKIDNETIEKIKEKNIVTGYPHFECVLNEKKIELYKDLKYYNIQNGQNVEIYYLERKGLFWCQQEIKKSIIILVSGMIMMILLIILLLVASLITK